MLGFVLANAGFSCFVLFPWWLLWCLVGVFGCVIMLSFQHFGVGDSVDENEDRNEHSDILCCKCLLKLLCVEYPCSLAICSNLVGSLFQRATVHCHCHSLSLLSLSFVLYIYVLF